MSNRRPIHTWDPTRLAELMRRVDAVMHDYESQCYEAQDRAPENWADFWRQEGVCAGHTRISMRNKIQIWINYASGQHEELISPRRTAAEIETANENA